MNKLILNKLDLLKNRFEIVKNLLTDKKIFLNKIKFSKIYKEYLYLNKITKYIDKRHIIKKNIKNLKYLLKDPEIKDLAKEEYNHCILKLKIIENKLKILIIPKEITDKRGCFIELKSGTGGNEASLFTKDLFKMYNKFIEKKKWNIEILNINYCDKGGFKDIIAKISNYGSYGILRFESGGHRVQRVPFTESQGRIHTSTCKVAVMQEIPEAEFPKIRSLDIKIDTFRSSGAGGQHVNTTDSAIRIKHISTGIVVECQDERSQHKNKSKAMSVLRARLYSLEVKKIQKQSYNTKKNLFGSGLRSDRIRTYNFHNGRVTDHRIGLTLYKLESIFKGNLDILINPIIKKYKLDKFKKIINKNNI
ncbi:MAG: peptide chain release factor 1 [Candidatus Makana argininalis]